MDPTNIASVNLGILSVERIDDWGERDDLWEIEAVLWLTDNGNIAGPLLMTRFWVGVK